MLMGLYGNALQALRRWIFDGRYRCGEIRYEYENSHSIPSWGQPQALSLLPAAIQLSFGPSSACFLSMLLTYKLFASRVLELSRTLGLT